jgi:hypothetical protein
MRMRSTQAAAVGALLALVSPPAGAQVPAQDVPLPSPSEAAHSVELQLLGGLESFTAGLSAGVAPGPYIGLAALAQPLFLVGVEAAYEAASLPLDDERLSGSPRLWKHTALGLLKLGVPVARGLRPYLGVGVGLSYLYPRGGEHTLYQEDLLLELPLALGLETTLGPLTGGVRVSYRSVLGESFERAPLGDASGGLVTAGVSLGGRF